MQLRQSLCKYAAIHQLTKTLKVDSSLDIFTVPAMNQVLDIFCCTAHVHGANRDSREVPTLHHKLH